MTNRLAKCGHEVGSHSGRQRLHCGPCTPPEPPRLLSLTCRGCGSDFAWERRTGPLPTYCSRGCAAKLHAQAKREDGRWDARLAAARANTKAKNQGRICIVCGGTFEAATSSKKYCSKRCSSKSTRHRAKERGGCADAGCTNGVLAKGLCSTHYNRTFHPGSQKRCPGDPERRRRALRIKTQVRRARMRGAEAEVVDRDRVGDRDGWKCGICHRRINRSLAYPHPRSPSLDHVIPISEGGPHTYANSRISHLSCNLARSNRGGDEQLALIG